MNKVLRKVRTIFNLLMTPSIKLMTGLDFKKKSLILIALICTTLTIVTVNLYEHLDKQIEIAEKELSGLDLLPHLFQLTQLLQQHRGASAGVLGGTEALEIQQQDLQKRVIDTFELIENKLPSTIAYGDSWQNIFSHWKSIEKHGMSWSLSDNFNEHIILIEEVYAITVQFSDDFRLTLPESLSLYYLINTTLYQLSPAQEYLGQVRAYGTGVLAKGVATERQKIDINTLMKGMDKSIKTLGVHLEKTAISTPDIKPYLSVAMKEINENTHFILKLVQSDIIEENFSTPPEDFFNLTTKAIDNSYDTLFKILIPTMKVLVNKELTNANKLLFINISIALALVLILLYFFLGIYLATKESMVRIINSTRYFSEGDFSKRINLESKNEFLPIAQSFNLMAAKLAESMKIEQKGLSRIRSIINSSQDALIQMNSQGGVIGWNHRAESTFGWSKKEAVGKRLDELIIPTRYRELHCDGLMIHLY